MKPLPSEARCQPVLDTKSCPQKDYFASLRRRSQHLPFSFDSRPSRAGFRRAAGFCSSFKLFAESTIQWPSRLAALLFSLRRGLFLSSNPYNPATTPQPLICQFTKNAHAISAVLAVGYEKAENCATETMKARPIAGQMTSDCCSLLTRAGHRDCSNLKTLTWRPDNEYFGIRSRKVQDCVL